MDSMTICEHTPFHLKNTRNALRSWSIRVEVISQKQKMIKTLKTPKKHGSKNHYLKKTKETPLLKKKKRVFWWSSNIETPHLEHTPWMQPKGPPEKAPRPRLYHPVWEAKDQVWKQKTSPKKLDLYPKGPVRTSWKGFNPPKPPQKNTFLGGVEGPLGLHPIFHSFLRFYLDSRF